MVLTHIVILGFVSGAGQPAAAAVSPFPSDLNTVFLGWMVTNSIYGDVNTSLRNSLATIESTDPGMDLTTLVTMYDFNTAGVAGGKFREMPAGLPVPEFVPVMPPPPLTWRAKVAKPFQRAYQWVQGLRKAA